MRLVCCVRTVVLGLLVLSLPLLAGCDNGPSVVSGKVTVDGTPVKTGAITFVPANGDGPTAAGTIKDGAYSAEVFPGAKKVEITGYEIVGKVPAYGDPKGPMKNVTKAVVPEKYNLHSNLTAEIVEGTNENLNFELTSK